MEGLFDRKEDALKEISLKYARLYRTILRETVAEERDVEECANDLLLALWNSIPPHRPESLPSYICKIARRIGINRYRHNTCQKRGEGYTLLLSELEECIPDPAAERRTADAADSERLRTLLSAFVRGLPGDDRVLFVRRYFYLEPVADLAGTFGMSANAVSVKLHRVRKKLKKQLQKEGFQG